MDNKTFSNNKAILITYKQAAERYNLGMTKVTELARKSDSLIKIGKAARIDVKKMDDYIFSLVGK